VSIKNEKIKVIHLGHSQPTTTLMNICTEYCKRIFTGCTNLKCTYAHGDDELKSSIGYATARANVTIPKMDVSFFPFIVKLPLDDSDDTEDESDVIQPSVSLSQFMTFERTPEYQAFHTVWLAKKYTEAREKRNVCVRENTYGPEDDMDWEYTN
jgi:hypothetical protein